MVHDAQRRPIVGGNWKMNTTLPTATELAEGVRRRIGQLSGIDIVLFPPFPNLEPVHQAIDGSALQLGAQNVFWEETGAYTGEVSAPMLTAVGCSWVIVGHSERRRILGESSEVVNKKLRSALRSGLQAILAVGETADERRAGQTEMVVEQQLRESVAGIGEGDLIRVVVAYEPVWAIGTGVTATPAQALEAHAFVRGVLERIYNRELAEATRIQYGGSVTGRNAAELMAEPGIDGALVGGASLNPDEFAAIALASASGQGNI